MAQSKRRKIPRFRSYEEEARFWDQHSLAEFEDDLMVVEKANVSRPLEHRLSVPLEASAITELAGVAERKGIEISTLASIWLTERLEQERARRKPKN